MKLCVRVREYAEIPKGYGIGYRLENEAVIMCYLFPINFVVRLWRWIFCFCIQVGYPNRWERWLLKEHQRGVEEGKRINTISQFSQLARADERMAQTMGKLTDVVVKLANRETQCK